MRWFVSVLAVCALAVSACGGDDDDGGGSSAAGDPAEAIESVATMLVRGQYGRAWESLHPQYQEMVPRGEYERCQGELMEDSTGLQIDDFEVVETYEDTVELPDGEVDAVAVTYDVHFSQGDESVVDTDTSRVVEVDGEWRWVLKRADDYVDECGA